MPQTEVSAQPFACDGCAQTGEGLVMGWTGCSGIRLASTHTVTPAAIMRIAQVWG
jgi:hypothetical protein